MEKRGKRVECGVLGCGSEDGNVVSQGKQDRKGTAESISVMVGFEASEAEGRGRNDQGSPTEGVSDLALFGGSLGGLCLQDTAETPK